MKRKHSFLYRNGLTLALIAFFCFSFFGQIYTGLSEHNEELKEYGEAPVDFIHYFNTGHFLQTTFENWESEFLQMAMYVLLTVWLRQKGSSESKDLIEKEEVDREPDPGKKDAPWPVRKGGIALAVYKNSLSLAFGILFTLSFCVHAAGSFKNFNEEQIMKGNGVLIRVYVDVTILV